LSKIWDQLHAASNCDPQDIDLYTLRLMS